MRRLILALFCLGLLVGTATAQGSLEEKYKKKLNKEFARKIPWVHDFNEALKLSRKTGKPIFSYFTRSYSP